MHILFQNIELRRKNYMPKETKSNGQKDALDRFYTPNDVVEKCI